MSLKKKITLMISIIIIIFLIIISLFIYSISAKVLNDEAEKYMEVQLLRAQEKIDLLVESIQQETQLLARDVQVEKFLKGEMEMYDLNSYLSARMDELNSERNYHMDLFIIDTSGVIISTTMTEAIYLDLSEREYVQKSLETKMLVTSDILHAKSDGSMIVNTVYPITDNQGELIALAGIAIRAEEFINFIKDFELGKSGYYVIIDSNGFILSHVDSEKIGQRVENSDYEINLTGLSKDTFIKDRSEGLIRTYKQMNSNNWILMANLPEKELEQKSARLLIYVFGLGILLIFAAIATSILVSGKISKPIVSITNYINSITDSSNYLDTTIAKTKSTFNGKKEDELENLNNSYENLKEYLDRRSSLEKDSYDLIRTSEELTTSLEKKSYETARFISTLSHDLRTSITLIKGFSQGLISDMVKDEKDRKRFLKEIYASAEGIENITFDILDSTYEAQYNQKLNMEKTSAVTASRAMEKQSRAYVENSNRKFESSIKVDENTWVYMDTIKINRVINNLITNAVKYSQEGSTVTLKIEEDRDHILFSVKDNGIGIPERDQKYIFDMFYKGDNKDKKSYGLGLFISKSIIDAHGSELKVESQVNKGTTFYFSLNKAT
ncbi:His Kinase A (phospho-acceptor) domain-containing protein [Dethiosulfatibacter aminovorans DSM 17477]|uniref:histidine kinase n=1 Tax=Dethiosulfatibacter aminovorans DSM 17477 TaxID=1121476 RepID=A0A1M6BIK9_9FIRM|nr:sensor histidine kinase [Dethiosulfatibacter aminovorans]SHI48428.1 His Kinase A (phospho-acceptor) domain-containing protein [Dethiosulfatibacter aminovorans DSM 17477]